MILLTSGLALGFSKTIRMNMIIGGIIPVLLMLNVLYSVIKAIKVKAKAKYKAPISVLNIKLYNLFSERYNSFCL